MSEDSDFKKYQDLLIRLDERTRSIAKEIEQLQSEIEKIKQLIKENRSLEQAELKLFVTKEEFQPLQRTLYAIAFSIIMTVIGTLVSLAVHKV